MSLQLAAQHLASKGRGKDSRLVHMTPGELKGLQALAKAKGGSLTINPETGLPEAGFLDDILPIAATAATMFAFPAAAPALGSMFGATAGSALATGLGAGLMAGGYNLLGQALAGQPLDLGRAAISGGLTGLTAGALQGAGMYNPAAASTPTAPTSNVLTGTAATTQAPVTAAQAVNIATADPGSVIAGMPEAANTGLAAGTSLPPGAVSKIAPPPSLLTGNQKLALGLGGVGALSLLGSRQQPKIPAFEQSPSYIRPYTYSAQPTDATGVYPDPYATTRYDEQGNPILETREREYFSPTYTELPIYEAAAGGLMSGGPVERMSSMDQSKGMYPMGMVDLPQYSRAYQRPASMEVVKSDYDTPVNSITGLQPMNMAEGGLSHLGSYSDGGRLLKGPGDGMSDNIPAMIGKKQPARLADGEFVVPADVVSGLGNGSTDAGAKRLYAMMDKVRKARTGTKKQGKQIKAEKYIPA